MRTAFFLFTGLLIGLSTHAQKKPLDHSVYDSWQSIGERMVSADGKYLAYGINLQEGDGELVIRALDGGYEKRIPRAYQASISDDSRFLVARIKPLFKDIRQAKIKKTATADMPKDSLVIIELGEDSLQKIAGIKSYKMPGRGKSWLAIHVYNTPAALQGNKTDSLGKIKRLENIADSLNRAADSIRKKIATAIALGMQVLEPVPPQKKEAKAKEEPTEEGTTLLLRNLVSGTTTQYNLVSEYFFNKYGTVLVIETTPQKSNEKIPATVLWHDLNSQKSDTVMKRFQDATGYAITDNGGRLAFVAERDSLPKAIRKFYKVWYYIPGMDSAIILVGPGTAGKNDDGIIQPAFNIYFSKDGSKLFLGLSPQQLVKDTNLVDFETAKLDLWNYKDDYLQPQQLVQVNTDLKKSWLSVVDMGTGKLLQLGNDSCETLITSQEGNGRFALGISTKNYRIQQQWTQHDIADLYLVDILSGQKKLIGRAVNANAFNMSPSGGYAYWYDLTKKQWISYEVGNGQTHQLSKSIPHPVFDEEDDHPDDPPAYGMMGWLENDQRAYVYDRYDIWSCDPQGLQAAVVLTGAAGRKNHTRIRYEKTDPEERYITNGQEILCKLFDEKGKGEGWLLHTMGKQFQIPVGENSPIGAFRVDGTVKARGANVLLFRKQQPTAQNLYWSSFKEVADPGKAKLVSHLNPQQSRYNWFSVELRRWKMGDGKMSEGLLYKPEDFDSTRKYPVIFYFYERYADNLYNYIEPMPVRASINIAYYTSNGYLVFDPDIFYKTGQPGEDAYNSVVSAAKYLAGFKWVDKDHMGLQGHSWGGYQVAYLVTRTNMFAAAEAGAPVSNMTSAYGGIRWGTGISRQFQYEKSQSRLGATLWDKPELYLKNSPLFRADKIQTPLLLLHNDKDDAVPWYQGIELFTALRRLGKPVWMASYNDELHGIIERRNRKDWTTRMVQFFDHYLKDKPAPKWMTVGIPAVKKGFDWGLDN